MNVSQFVNAAEEIAAFNTWRCTQGAGSALHGPVLGAGWT